MANTIKLRIEGEAANLQAFDEAKAKIDGLTESAHEFVETLKLGVGIDLGGRVIEAIAEIPNILREAITEGVRFNAELETVRLTLAGMTKQFSEGQISSFNQGLQVSDQLIGKMRDRANDLGLSFEALLETYKTTAGAMFHSGVHDLEQQLDLVVLLSRAMQGMGISGFMATRDIQDILTGMADRTKAGRELGVKDADIEAAKEQGKLYEFLSEKLSGFTDAANAGTHTMDAELARLHNEIQGLEADISKPIFEALKSGLAALNQELQKPETVGNLKALGFEIAEIVKGGMSLLDWAVRNADALQTMAHVAGILAVALAAMQVAKISVELGLWAASLLTSKVALDEETAALARNTAAQAANAAARAVDTTATAAEAAATGAAATVGRTTVARYAANSIGGVVGAGAARGATTIGAGEAGALAASEGGIVAALAAAATPLIIAAIGLAIGGAIGSWLASHDRANEQRRLEDSRKDFMGGNGLDRMNTLMQATFGADSRDQEQVRKELEKQIFIEQQGAQLEGLRGQLARERLEVLQRMLEQLPQFVTDNNRQLAQEQAMEDAEAKRAENWEKAQRHMEAMEQTRKLSQAIGSSQLEAMLKDAQTPDQKMTVLRAQEMTARMGLGEHNFTTTPVDPLTASPAEIRNSAGGAVDAGAGDKIIADANKIEEIQREILKILDEEGKKTEENMHQEAERFLAIDKSRKALEGERDALQATLAGEYDVAAAAERRRQIEEQVAKLVKEGMSQAEARSLIEENAALKVETSRKKALTDLQEEHDIMQAKISGETSLVDLLTRQREIRQQIEALEKAGLPANRAAALALQAADDRHGIELAKRNEELEKVRADVAVQSARTPGQRQRAELDKLRTDSYYELKGKGLSDDQVNDIIGDRMDNYRRQHRGRTIGGPTTRSAQDHLGDQMSDDDWANQFKPKGIAAGSGSPLDARPGGDPATSSPLNRPLGKSSDQAWNDIFHRGGVGPLAPSPAAPVADEQYGPPAPDKTADADGGKGGNAADSLQKGGKDLSGVGSKLQGAADAIQAGVQGLQSVTQSLTQLGPTITSTIQGLQQEIDDLNSQISDLANS